MDKIDLVYADKVPMSTDNHIGIEIEFVSKMDPDTISDMIVDHDLYMNCTLKEDGSIDEYLPSCGYSPCDCGDPECTEVISDTDCVGHELTVLCTEKDLSFILNKVNNLLIDCGAEVNKSCGLHVHIDCRSRSYKQVVSNFLSKQKEMRKMVPDERKVSGYCKPLTKKDLKIKDQTLLSRYKDINIRSYPKLKTIEIRLHEATVNTKDIMSWCKYLIGVADKKRVSKQYVNTRIKKCS